MSIERRSPLAATYREAGAEFATVRGCRLPERFSDVVAECRAVRQAAGVLDRSDRAHLAATGADAKDFLHRMLSNDVHRLQPGQGCYAALLNAQGQMQADLYVFQMEDHLLLETGFPLKDRLRGTLDNYVIADDVTLEDRSQPLAALSVEGPAAGKLLRAAGAARLPAQELDHARVTLGGGPVLVVRLSETGEEGYRLIFAVEYAQALWDALAARREAVPWQPVGCAALNILRIEAGIPWYGVDMDERTLPPEAGLEARAISYNKGCYVGQEIIERVHSRGHVNRRLTGLVLSGESLPGAGARLVSNGKDVGYLTSAVRSPTLRHPIALGYVRREYLQPGTRLSLEGGTAEVAGLPFYSPPK
ncbi:aminomethyltransferase family protein [Acidobacteriia bacterium AH_259_A11_L15]|nr:aminomethyltransferase family protein [Acidobacteriia bacterium AH_259_A11_L15]